MGKKGLFYMVALFFFAGAYYSCDEGNDNNYVIYRAIGVLNYNESLGNMTMGTRGGVFVVPELAQKREGLCINAVFKIDYDNQPARDKYLIATEIEYDTIGQKNLLFERGDIVLKDYKEKISSIEIQDNAAVPNYFGMMFLQPKFDAYPQEEFTYELLCFSDSIDGAIGENGLNTLYLKAKKTNASSEGTKTGVYGEALAFDMNGFVDEFGEDVIDEATNIVYRVADFNMKYLNSFTKDSIPVYKSYGSAPIRIWTYKK